MQRAAIVPCPLVCLLRSGGGWTIRKWEKMSEQFRYQWIWNVSIFTPTQRKWIESWEASWHQVFESGSGQRFSGGSSPPWWAAQLGSERSHWVKVHPATCQPPRCHTKITADIYIGNVKPSSFFQLSRAERWLASLQTCAQLELCNLIWCLLKYIMASSHLLNFRVHMNKMKVHIRLKHERLSVSLPQWFDWFLYKSKEHLLSSSAAQ